MSTELERIEAEVAACEKQFRRAKARLAELREKGRQLERDRDRARLKYYIGEPVKYRFDGDTPPLASFFTVGCSGVSVARDRGVFPRRIFFGQLTNLASW